MPVHDRGSFESLYAGQPRWEIGRPQRALLEVADRITGSVLDAGCGTGENALFFASQGQRVTGNHSAGVVPVSVYARARFGLEFMPEGASLSAAAPANC